METAPIGKKDIEPQLSLEIVDPITPLPNLNPRPFVDAVRNTIHIASRQRTEPRLLDDRFKQTPDSDLIELTKTDPEAFGELYQRYSDRIHRFVLVRVSNPEDAEDITAKTFLNAYKALRDSDFTDTAFTSWLYTIANNATTDFYRKNKTVATQTYIDPDIQITDPQQIEEDFLELERATALAKLIGELKSSYRQVIILSIIHDMSNAEIGRIIGKTEGAVKSTLFRATKALQKITTEQGITADLF